MKKCLVILTILGACLSFVGCSNVSSHSRGVYLLMDTSGTYKSELKKACSIIYYLLGTLKPGDSFGVARIDTGSFSEKDIIAKKTFDNRPSVSNQQKRLFKERVDKFVASVKGSPYTDITGGILQAVEYLNETGAGKKYILIFSDLKEDLRKGYIRNFDIEMPEVHVVALNVTKLRSDNVDPREYLNRLEYWQKRVQDGGATWRVVNDLERLDTILADG
jgi:hypothetical protein